ncbi:hypothetical protein DL98DRAFT_614271 [Cadophora sp. DSE1049]|nr:hypothetical protein DL98DRAFT_614271 [Cadophora sp. DSE1049]
MPSTLANDASPGRNKAHLNTTVETHDTKANLSVSVEDADDDDDDDDDDEVSKNLKEMSISPDQADEEVGVTDTETAKAAAAAAKKKAMNKRKKENNRKNKAEAKRKVEEEAANKMAKQSVPKTERIQARGIFRDSAPSILELAGLKPLGSQEMQQTSGMSVEQTNQLDSIVGSMPSHIIREAAAIGSQAEYSPGMMAEYEKIGVLPRDISEPEDDLEDGREPINDSTGAAFVVKPAMGKGLGVFATRNIKEGTEIFREAAILCAKNGEQQWIQIEASLNVLSGDKRMKFLALAMDCGCKRDNCVETDLMKVWRANSFHNHHESAKGEYVYEIASRLNHSCAFNAYRGFTKEGHIVFFASRDIKRGMEITHSYMGGYGTTTMRRKLLFQRSGFICECTACKRDLVLAPSHLEETFQHTFLRGGHIPAEVEALRSVAAWTTKILPGLKRLEDAAKRAIFNQVCTTGRLPGFISPLMQEYFDPIRELIATQNAFGLSDEFLLKFVARSIFDICEKTERSFKFVLENQEKFQKILRV